MLVKNLDIEFSDSFILYFFKTFLVGFFGWGVGGGGVVLIDKNVDIEYSVHNTHLSGITFIRFTLFCHIASALVLIKNVPNMSVVTV